MATFDIPTQSPISRRLSAYAAYVRRNPASVICCGILLFFLIVALAAPLIAADPIRIEPSRRFAAPDATAIWGRDHLGRDVFARAVFGTRISLLVGFSVAILTTVFGVAIGIYAGLTQIGGLVVMRLTDAMMAMPAVLLAIAFASIMNGGLLTVIIAIAIAEVPRMVRLVRSVVLGVSRQPHVTAAISIGTSGLPLVWRHILPSTLGPVLVQATYACASAIIASAVLSFLGVGMSPEIPSWGGMMADARSYFRIHPIFMLYPGVLLSMLVLAVNILGDRLSDALDPRKMRKGSL